MNPNTELVTALRANIDGLRRDGKMDPITAAALTTFMPDAPVLPGGIAYAQNTDGFIGNYLLPETAIPGGSLKGTYKVFGNESFLVLRDATTAGLADVVGINGEHLRADLGMTMADVTLQVHGYSAWIDDVERAQAASMGENIEDRKAAMIKTKVDTGREADAAALITATGSYASSSYYTTLSGTTQWSHASSHPIAAVVAKVEFLRGVLGNRRNLAFWMSPTAFNAFRFHADVLALVNGGATRSNPALPISTELISAILSMPVVVGDAVQTTAIGGAKSDVWNDAAGLIAIAPPNTEAPKFGATVIQDGWPTQRVERNPHLGAKGIDVLYYDDAYKHVVQLNSAGYLWLDVTA